jgi:probable HAF family extracellular repeat protein
MATSYAYGVSRDGRVVVGTSTRGLAAVQPTPGVRVLVNVAFRWTVAGGMEDLGFPAGGNDSTATDVSADGTTVVGTWTVAATGETRGFCWTAAQGMVDLGVRGAPLAVSGDGGVVVGTGGIDGEQPASLYRGFRWTRARGATRFPASALFAGFGAACDISADGAIVIGTINCADSDGRCRTRCGSGIPPAGRASSTSGVA